jgi:hypothetical protein
MAASDPDYVGVIPIAVACLLPAIIAGWKAASWRGDVFNKWSDRVTVTHAGLNERATRELIELQDEVSAALAGDPDQFSPAQLSVDPDPLVAHANLCARLLVARDRLRPRFRRYRLLGRILIPIIVLYVAGVILATLHFVEVLDGSWAKWVGLVTVAAAVIAGVMVFGLYAHYESRLTAAEEMAAGEGR